jgi:thiopurine S-methyltransferase
MDRDFWLKRWRENRIGFHLSEVNPLLQRFHDEAAAGAGRVLVPLCGKSLDLEWLAAKGHEVVGVDLSPMAAQAFMEEHQLPADISEEPPFTVFHAGPITFYVGDIFDFRPDRLGLFDLIYDRAALIALPADRRPPYAERIRAFMAPGGKMLLIALEYDRGAMEGPPYTVTEREVRSLFEGLKIHKLLEYDCLESEPHFKQRGLEWMKETAYRIHHT